MSNNIFFDNLLHYASTGFVCIGFVVLIASFIILFRNVMFKTGRESVSNFLAAGAILTLSYLLNMITNYGRINYLVLHDYNQYKTFVVFLLLLAMCMATGAYVVKFIDRINALRKAEEDEK